MALLATGVSTALPCEPAAGPGLCGDPKLLPVVPCRRAFEVLGPGDPPVPLIVLPFDNVDPDAPDVPDDPAVCARAKEHAAR